MSANVFPVYSNPIKNIAKKMNRFRHAFLMVTRPFSEAGTRFRSQSQRKKDKARQLNRVYAQHNKNGGADQAWPDFQSLIRQLYKRSHPDLLRDTYPGTPLRPPLDPP